MKKITLLTILFAAIGITANAQVVATGSYSIIESGTIVDVTHDEDNGDGLNDGAKYIDGSDNVSVTAGAAFTFDGTMENGTSYTVNTTLYNYNNSYCTVSVSLYNKTDESLLATVSSGLQGVNHESGDDIDAVELTYTALSSDAGDVLEIRYIKTQAGNSRNFAIDILELGGAAVGPTVVSSAGSWNSFGNTLLSNTTDDADNGDGANDGAILVDGQENTIGLGAAYTFDEGIKENLVYNVVTNLYNPTGSYNKVVASLYNVTTSTELATTAVTNLPAGEAAELTVSYTGTSGDVGNVLELRLVDAFDGNQVRNFSIDNASIGGSVISTTLTLLAENNILDESITVFPNPATTTLHIKEDASVVLKSISLLDITGKVVYKGTFSNSLNVASYPSGVYFLILESETGSRLTKTIILK